MMRHNSIVRLTLTFLAMLALAGPAAAGTQGKQEKQVPFRGRLEGVATFAPLTPPFVSVNLEGGGQATQLGNFEVSIPHVVNRSNERSGPTTHATSSRPRRRVTNDSTETSLTSTSEYGALCFTGMTSCTRPVRLPSRTMARSFEASPLH